MQKPGRATAYWLAPHSLLRLHFYTAQDNQSRGGTTLMGLGSFIPIIN